MTKSRPKVLHVITGLEVGGAEKMLVKTLPYLKEYKHVVCTLLDMGPLAKPLQDAGVQVMTLGIKQDGLFAGIRRFRKLTREPFTITISYLIHADLFVRVFGVLFGLQNRIVFIRNNLLHSKYRKLLLVERMTQSFVRAYLSVSSAVAESYIRELRYPRKKFSVISNGVDTSLFVQAKPLTRASLGVKKEQLLFLSTGKFYAQKDHSSLIKAWAEFVKEKPGAVLLLAGDGPLRDVIERQVANLKLHDSVQFLGVRDDVPALLKTADVFVLPSLFEGMSNALLEAMSAGRIIVASDITENREVISEEEGILVKAKNPNSLLDGLRRAASLSPSQVKTYQQAAELRAVQQFDISQSISRLNKIYAEFCGE
jgi:glycosyltransferase involved in cell wall biosynthesis